MRKIVIQLLLVTGFLIIPDRLYPQSLQVGDQLSTLDLEEYIQAPRQHYKYEDLKGRALVLEFWATWHAPSIKSILYLNDLSKEFETEPIQFISITHENKSTVVHFLKTHNINGWIGIDKHREVHKNLGVYSIPQTILINPSGRIEAITKSNEINSEILKNLIDGKPIAIQTNKAPTYKDSSIINTYDGIYSSSSTSVNDLLQTAYRYSPARIIAPDSILDTRLNISIKYTGAKKDDFYNNIQNTLESTVGLEIKQEVRNTDVYVLSAPNGITKGLGVQEPLLIQTSTADGVIAASSAPIRALVKQLEEVLKVPIVDMTNFQDTYVWAVIFDGKEPTSIIDSLREQLGLNLKLERREIEMLIVESK